MRTPPNAFAFTASQPAAQREIQPVSFSSGQDIVPPAAWFEPDDVTDDDFPDPASDDEARWEVFLPDDDELDPLPDSGDFWIDTR